MATIGIMMFADGYPPTSGEEPMSHRFKVGDLVARKAGHFAPSEVFEVIKQLPGSNEREYHIKCANESHQRLVSDSELIKA
jgi:hypothetical protein